MATVYATTDGADVDDGYIDEQNEGTLVGNKGIWALAGLRPSHARAKQLYALFGRM